MKRTVLCTLVAALAAGSAPARARPAVHDFQGTAEEWLAEIGVGPNASWHDVLEEAFLQARIGGFDVRLPRDEIAVEEHAERIEELLRQAVRMQVAWGEWNHPGDLDLERDADRLTRWFERLSRSDLRKAAESESGDFYAAAGANDRVLESAERLVELLSPEPPGDGAGAAEGPSDAQVIVAPSRRLFVRLVCVTGLLFPEHRPATWHEGSLFAPNAWGAGYQIVPLLNPAHPFELATVDEGWEIDRYLTSSLEQHAADRLAASLLHGYFRFSTDPLLETALSTELVIATIGSTRLVDDFSSFSWSRAGASTKPYQRFVPGGNPAGGTLPARKARPGPVQAQSESDVHVQEIGNEYFVEDLRERQVEGRKLAARDRSLARELRKDRTIHFVLREDGEEHLVGAPLLGDAASSKPIPTVRFLDDYESFHGRYRALFVHWLVEEADEELANRVPVFLRAVATRTGDETVGTAAEEAFGVPMGWTGPGDEESLEARFLEWLSKQ